MDYSLPIMVVWIGKGIGRVGGSLRAWLWEYFNLQYLMGASFMSWFGLHLEVAKSSIYRAIFLFNMEA
jgi:hypothetical protein